MNMAVKLLLTVVLALIVLSAAWVFFLLRPSDSDKAAVIRDNEVLYTFDLSRTENQTIRIEYPDGGYNIVEIKDGTICISDADCPDQTCVKTGVLKSSGIPVVCLPHHLVIKYINNEQKGEPQ